MVALTYQGSFREREREREREINKKKLSLYTI